MNFLDGHLYPENQQPLIITAAPYAPGWILPGHGQPADVSQLRAAHADRERAVDVLKAAFAEGRLDQDEYTTRIGQAYASRTYGELAALTADLPIGPLGTLPAVPATPPYLPYPSYLPFPAGPPAPVPAAAPPAVAAQPGPSALAFISLLLGMVGMAFDNFFPAWSIGIFVGFAALTRTGPHRLRGRWMAVTGIILSVIGVLAAVGAV